jgi:Lon protease-like protein
LSLTDRYRTPNDLPRHIPVFPLQECIILPRSTLPLNVFEPRYLQMVDDALAGERLIGIVQPLGKTGEEESPADNRFPLRRTGCLGRITSFSETEDARVLITLTGVARFDIVDEVSTDKPYRICEINYDRFASDLIHGHGQDEVDWPELLRVLKTYLAARQMSADWESIERSPAELLVNTLSVISPYGPEEKQALLEASSLKERSEVLIALAQMEMAATDDDSSSTLQ